MSRTDIAGLLKARLEFYALCVDDHEPKAPSEISGAWDEQRIFDNSLNRVPGELLFVAGGELGPGAYAEYLDFRMAAFALGPALTADALIQLVDQNHEAQDQEILVLCASLAERLTAQRPAESEALIRRLAQLPRAAVIEEWYREGPHFERWAEAVEQEFLAEEHERWSVDYGGSYSALLQEEDGDELARGRRRVADFIQSRVATATQRLEAHLRGEAGLDGATVEALRLFERVATPDPEIPTWRGSILLRVTADMVDAFAEHTEQGDLLNAFVAIMARVSGCAFCDFLLYENGVLRPVVNSNPEADLAKLLKEGAYHRAQGITGSVALFPEGVPRRWVGTNCLADDPRQSPSHASVYAHEVGPINDYWVFPVFANGEMYGAFRLVNRIRSRWQCGTPWSESMLWELREVAAWCETTALPRLGRTVLPRHVTETAHSGAVQHIKADCDLDWADDDFLVRLVTHMTRVSHRKVEKNALGCCIGVFASPDDVVAATQPYFAAGDVRFGSSDTTRYLDDAASNYPRIDPRAGMFVFDSAGRGRAVVHISSSADDETPAKRMTRLHPKGIVLLLDRGQDCIRIYARGELMADYYLSDATGDWTLRSYRSLQKQVIDRAPEAVSREDVEEVFDRAVELSYGRIGAMLILGDGVPPRTSLLRATKLQRVTLRTLSNAIFADIARTDGAVHIEHDCRVTAMGAIIRTALGDPGAADNGFGGSRHSSAAAFSHLAPDHVVFVISENRPISVFVGGEPVFSRR